MAFVHPSKPVAWLGSGQLPRTLLLGDAERPRVSEEAARLRPVIAQHLDIILEDFGWSQDLSSLRADLAVVLGGDGSILRAAKRMGAHQIPVIGVNLGKLGFLADLQPNDLVHFLPDIRTGRCRVVEHLMLRCQVLRGSEVVRDELGLNEAAILAGPPFSMVHIDLRVDDEMVTSYSCDGLIVSTPVGSTAHSLSAGGPILRKDIHAFVISPVSPHTLTVRPVVDSADRVYEMVVRQPNEATTVVLDGRVLCPLSAEHRVRIERAQPTFKLVECHGHSYYRTLREKLGWSGAIQRSDRGASE
jgi:NAD+ kinase